MQKPGIGQKPILYRPLAWKDTPSLRTSDNHFTNLLPDGIYWQELPLLSKCLALCEGADGLTVSFDVIGKLLIGLVVCRSILHLLAVLHTTVAR